MKKLVQYQTKERIKKGNKGMLDDIPKALPAMLRSIKLQKRASENGFDWENPMILKKNRRGKNELEVAIDSTKK